VIRTRRGKGNGVYGNGNGYGYGLRETDTELWKSRMTAYTFATGKCDGISAAVLSARPPLSCCCVTMARKHDQLRRLLRTFECLRLRAGMKAAFLLSGAVSRLREYADRFTKRWSWSPSAQCHHRHSVDTVTLRLVARNAVLR